MQATNRPSLSALSIHLETQLKQQQLGVAWADALSPAEASLLSACVRDAAELTLRAMAATPAEEDALVREKAQISAQLLNLTAAAGVRAVDALWSTVRVALNGAIRIAIAAI